MAEFISDKESAKHGAPDDKREVRLRGRRELSAAVSPEGIYSSK